MSATAPPIVVAPFANERIREWPPEHFRHLIELLLADPRARIAVVGTLAQRARAHDIVRAFPAPRVENTCGRLSWDGLLALIDAAPFVVANNGTAVASAYGTSGDFSLAVIGRDGNLDYVTDKVRTGQRVRDVMLNSYSIQAATRK